MNNYDTDFYLWTQEQAQKLRAGEITTLDLENLAEEIESMGKRDRRAMISELVRLLSHLLKWQCQPERRGSSWVRTISSARDEIDLLIDDNHTFKNMLSEFIATAYPKAIKKAHDETGLPVSTFPKECPWTFEEFFHEGFFPA